MDETVLSARLRRFSGWCLVATLVVIPSLLGACRSAATVVPSPDLDSIRTAAVSTYRAGLTQDAPTPRPSPPVTLTMAAGPVTASSGTPACLGLRFVRDVTIPDNAPLTPAEVFTKTWQVENSGTCPWKPGFQVVLIGGLAMGGSPFRLTQTVGPGGSIQVSIKMVTPPNQSGVVRGTWKMSDTDGAQFGDYLSVVIVVGTPTPATPSATP